MSRKLFIGLDHGETVYNYEFSYTVDGDTWLTVLFEDIDDARDFASDVREENRGNKQLSFYVRRLVQVQTADFFNSDLCAVDMRVIDRVAAERRSEVESPYRERLIELQMGGAVGQVVIEDGEQR